jgi:hypothetical protein
MGALVKSLEASCDELARIDADELQPIARRLRDAAKAVTAQRRLAAGDSDTAFLRAKIATARFFADQDLSRAAGLAEATVHAAADTMALTDDQF